MSSFIEFHVIQNFAPSNLNRDDTGAPKDAIFGGHRRARVSSQSLKRRQRMLFSDYSLLDARNCGFRTRRLKRLLAKELTADDPNETESKIESALAAINVDFSTAKDDTREKTEYSIFLSEKELNEFVHLIRQYWDELKPVKPGGKKEDRAKNAAPSAFRKVAKKLFDGGKAADIALFGRMLADLPELNQDAACQVAHAISTHRVEREFDYYTTVDDRAAPDETGADMIGQIEFNSATFYRYAVLDVSKLSENLHGDRKLALSTVEALTTATVRAVPTGKQNTFAAHNAPDFIGVSVRRVAPLNLANAFEKPVVARMDHSLTEQSVDRLSATDDKLSAVYGDDRDQWVYLDLTSQWPKDKGERQPNLDALAKRVRAIAADMLEV